MTAPEREDEIAAHLRILRAVARAISVGTALLPPVAYFTVAQRDGEGLAPSRTGVMLAPVLAVVAVMLLALAPAVKRALFKRAEAEGFGSGPGPWLAAHRQATIAGLALREATAVLGFLLALLTGRLIWSYVGSGLALLAMAFDWPRRGELEER